MVSTTLQVDSSFRKQTYRSFW